MTAGLRITGLMQVRDEWPLVAVSASHALARHVDELYVLVHSSSDQTATGLKHLSRLWSDRLRVISYADDDHFWQEACLTALIEYCQASAPDWLYVLDADEFLLAGVPAQSLRDVLADVPDECSLVRYEVHNWVSPCDFDERRLDDYRRLTRRAEVTSVLKPPSALCGEEIRRGELNFFDLPFGSKVVIRNDGTRWVAAGSHGSRESFDESGREIATTRVRAAHVPFLSFARLRQRAMHGGLLTAADGFSPDHGWQSQLVYALAAEERLPEFWAAHSLVDGAIPPGDVTPPSTAEDEALVVAISPVIDVLQTSGFWAAMVPRQGAAGAGPTADSPEEPPEEESVAFRSLVHAVRRIQTAGDRLRGERDALKAAGDRAEQECERLTQELSAASALARESHRQMDAVRLSTSWRLTRPLRAAGRLWRACRSRRNP